MVDQHNRKGAYYGLFVVDFLHLGIHSMIFHFYIFQYEFDELPEMIVTRLDEDFSKTHRDNCHSLCLHHLTLCL